MLMSSADLADGMITFSGRASARQPEYGAGLQLVHTPVGFGRPKPPRLSIGATMWRTHEIGGKEVESLSSVRSAYYIEGEALLPIFGRDYEYIMPTPKLQEYGVEAHILQCDRGPFKQKYERCIVGGTCIHRGSEPDARDLMSIDVCLLERDGDAKIERRIWFPSVYVALQESLEAQEESAIARIKVSRDSNPRLQKERSEGYDGYRGESYREEMTIREGDTIEIPHHPLRMKVKEIVLPDLEHDPPIYGWVEFYDYLAGEEPPEETK